MSAATITHTIVVEFPSDKSPRYHAGMEVLGGQVVAVAFDGNRLEVEEALLEALQDILSDGIHSDVSPPLYRKARAAIAKATGAA